MPPRRFDVIVIGAGPAGEVVAGSARARGLEVAIVESSLVGGECAYWACMPSKALLRPDQALAEARRVPGASAAVTGRLDVGAVLARRDEVVHGFSDEAQLPWLADRGIALFRGRGRLAGERLVRVGDDVLEAARAVVIATGSAPAMPAIPGLDDARPWTSHEATAAEAIPDSVIVLGGGAVGLELADAYATLGAHVALVESAARLAPGEEEFVGEQIRSALEQRGVEIHVPAEVRQVRRLGGTVTVTLADGAEHAADELIVATGRRPASADLGLALVGLEAGAPIEVDDAMQVPHVPWLYAVGDVNGRALLTHVAKYQARIAAAAIAGEPVRARGDGDGAPRVIFTEPQMAAVGLTLRAARERGLDARAYDVETSGSAGASFVGRDAAGTSRLVVDERRGVLIGATFTGVEVAEWLAAATIAIVGEVRIDTLWDAMPAFPTRSEIWTALLEKRSDALRS